LVEDFNNHYKEVKVKRILFFLLIVTAISALYAQSSQKLAYVDSEVILNQYPEAIKAQSDLDALASKWSRTIDSLTNDLQTAYNDFQKQSATMTQDKQREVGQELVRKEQYIREFQQQKFGTQSGELYAKQEELLAPVKEKIFAAIEQVSKEEGVQFVFDKAGDVVLLYADSAYDITFKVLDKLKRGK
jgi:outer membrane protein